MRIFAIGDLHLSGSAPKPMSIFGLHWENHWDKIRADWEQQVGEEDAVLIPGDISWAMTLTEAAPDLSALGALPGRKVLIRGNHDYWWSSISRVRGSLPPSVHALQNDHLVLSGWVFCGTRGWQPPGARGNTAQDQKIYARELLRLQMSMQGIKDPKHCIVLLHFPPFDEGGRPTPVTELLADAGPSHVVYGHLHGESAKNGVEGVVDGIKYHLVSCDHLGFALKRIV